jgi:hypothetical protein
VAGAGKKWRDRLAPILGEMVADAEATATDCVLRVGRASVQIGLNRRFETEQGVVMKPNPAGITVPWVDVLRVDRLDGTPAAVLFSHAAHPVIIHGASKLISADFPGYAVQKLKSLFGGNVLAMFAQGCGAQINGDPLRGGFAAAEHAGSLLAEAAFQAACNSKPLGKQTFTITSVSAGIPLAPLPTRSECARVLKEAEDRLAKLWSRTFSDEQMWDLQDQIDIGGAKSQSQDDVQPMDGQPWWLTDNVLCLRDLMKKVEAGEGGALRFDAQMVRVGDEWSLLATSHELFAEYQHWFDANAPTGKKMMWAYTNGCESYIPTNEELQRDGYETASFPAMDSAALKYRHRRAIGRGAENDVIEALRSLWA